MDVRRRDGRWYVKGAPEVLLPRTGSAAEAHRANLDLAGAGLRVLAVAMGPSLDHLRLLGLFGIADPPREDARRAIAEAHAAGVTTLMITGDQRATAEAIGLELGIIGPGRPAQDVVVARATAEDKLLLVRRAKEEGHIVAMTGDGVNDAPALREAHIGVAMGVAGTEVTRGASDLVLTDDRFASIIEAIREGRGIYDNIRKVLVYLLGGNAGELAIVLGASAAGLPVPLLPMHLLWINLVTDGAPALALATDEPEDDVLERPPRAADEPMLGRSEWMRIAAIGLLDAAVAGGVFLVALRLTDVDQARTLGFTTLVFCELLRAFAARSRVRTGLALGLRSNRRLLVVVGASILLQLVILCTPATQTLLRLAPVAPAALAGAAALGFVPVTLLELAKLVRGGRDPVPSPGSPR